ncbi:hypothetical protein IEQ34_026637 [Dendrobium chrysotoxum]|uniref:NADP-dependent oxidoreductase domain-containing protein n=1 Tax=Dendrobium chrysotoxum TaxID=161865 RepID=A0AAV7FLN6_DENCH|nr:hypothetical protein IEQ34_026637 [Dendrobium chrysotoxum]
MELELILQVLPVLNIEELSTVTIRLKSHAIPTSKSDSHKPQFSSASFPAFEALKYSARVQFLHSTRTYGRCGLQASLPPSSCQEMEDLTQILIPRVKLGSQGLEVSKLGYGCMSLSGVYNSPVDDENGISVILHAFNRGITFFDTSDAYGPHTNEILVGKALRRLPRERVQLATKFGVAGASPSGLLVNGSPEYARACCIASLERLGVDYIDLYYQHRIDTSIGELKKLVEEGMVKYIGLSEASSDTIRRAHAVHPISAVQMEWSLWSRDIEEEIVSLCRSLRTFPWIFLVVHAFSESIFDSAFFNQIEMELGIGIVPYSPLGRGFFGGKAVVESIPVNSFLVFHPRFSGDNLEKNKVLYARLANIAVKHRCKPSQLALAWILHQGNDVAPIPGQYSYRKNYVLFTYLNIIYYLDF